MPFLPLSFFGNHVVGGIEEVAEKGKFSINMTLPAASSHTEEITLSKATYTMGTCILYIPNAATNSWARRRGSSFIFGTSTDEAIAGSSDMKTIGVGCGCTAKVPEINFFFYEDDSTLSSLYFAANSVGQVYFRSAYIDGDKLKITFENTHGSGAAKLLIEGRFIVIK